MCLQKGAPVANKNGKSKYVRYIKTIDKPEMRTHSQTIADTISYLNTSNTVHGMKGISPLIALPCFDLIDNVTTDHMHGVFLGIVNDMLDIWFGKKSLKNIKPGFKINKTEDRKTVNNKILALKPYSRISRKPRSLFDRSFYKAMEYRNLLWYYIHYSVYGILSQSAINHFDLLSAASFILNKTAISNEEVHKAGTMLEKFADGFQDNYGDDSVTMNVHMLRHYAHNVLNGGPLWSQSMFGFESRMGDFKKGHRSKVYISDSIVKKYCLNESKSIRPTVNETTVMLRGKTIDVGHNIAAIFMEFGLLPINGSRLYEISYETRINNEVFKSTSSRTTKSIDYFVRMKDQTLGMIEIFVKHHKIVYLLLQKYEISYEKHHLNEVKLKKPISRQIYRCDDIYEKLIYLKFGRIEVVSNEPNKYEKT